MQDERVHLRLGPAGKRHHLGDRRRHLAQAEVEDLGPVHVEVAGVADVAVRVRVLDPGLGTARRPGAPARHLDDAGAGAVRAEHEMPGAGGRVAHDQGRAPGVAEERVRRAVARVGRPAQRVAGAKQNGARSAVHAEQGRLLQRVDPTGTTQRDIVGRHGAGEPEPAMEQARVVRLRVIGRLRDEDDRVDLGGRLRTGREETRGGVGAKIQRGLSGGRNQPATQTHGAGGAFERGGVLARGEAIREEIADQRAGRDGETGEPDGMEGGLHRERGFSGRRTGATTTRRTARPSGGRRHRPRPGRPPRARR